MRKFKLESLNGKNTENITALLKEMEEVCLEASIPKVKYEYPLKNLHKQSEEYQEILFNWLVKFYNSEYKEAKIMWNKMSPHGWKNLKELLNVHDQPEQLLLQLKFKALRTAFFNRPRPVKFLRAKIIKSKE